MTEAAEAPKEKDIAEKVVRGGFQIGLNINGRQIQMSGYIQEGETKADLNRRMDEYQEIIDRQLVRADLENQRGQLKIHTRNLEQVTEQYEGILKRKKDGGKPITSQMKQTLDNYDQTVENIKMAIRNTEKAIAEDEKKLAL